MTGLAQRLSVLAITWSAVSAGSRGLAFGQCPASWMGDPTSCSSRSESLGHVIVGAQFNFNGGTSIDAAELQCAVDCLDGDPDADWHADVPASGIDYIPHGAVLELLPTWSYLLVNPVELPQGTLGPLLIKGNGALLALPAWNIYTSEATSTCGFSMLRRRATNETDPGALEQLRQYGRGWRIESVRFIGRCTDDVHSWCRPHSPPAPAQTCTDPFEYAAIDVVGTIGLTVESCTFQLLDNAVLVASSDLPAIASSALSTREEAVHFGPGTVAANLRKVTTRAGEAATVEGTSAVIEQFEFLHFCHDGVLVRVLPDTQVPSRVTIRDTHFEGEHPDGLIATSASGQLRVDGFTTVPYGPGLQPADHGDCPMRGLSILDASPPTGLPSDVTFDRVGTLPADAEFRATDDATVLFRHENVSGTGEDLTSPRWWPAGAPTRVHHDHFGFRDPRTTALPPAAAALPGWLVSTPASPPPTGLPNARVLWYFESPPASAWTEVELTP